MNLSQGEMLSRLLKRANVGEDVGGRGKVIVFPSTTCSDYTRGATIGDSVLEGHDQGEADKAATLPLARQYRP